MASSKTAVQVASLTLIPWTGEASKAYTTILGSADPTAATAVTIRMPAQKDLIITAALECGLYTRTLVRSKGNQADTTSAMASIQARVVLDPGTPQERVAAPGEVTFSRRTQDLSATLQGIVGNLACFPLDATGVGVFDPNAVGCLLTAEEISLMLTTLTANAFVFVAADVGVGIHNIVLQARIDLGGSAQAGETNALALVGKGALEVEDVRLIRNGVIDLS